MKSQELTNGNLASRSASSGSTEFASAESLETKSAAAESSSVEVGLNAARTVYWWILVALLITYGLSGMTQIAPGEVGVTRRFGRWMQINGEVVIHRPGLLFAFPEPFDRVEKIPVKRERAIEIQLLPAEVMETNEDVDGVNEESDDGVESQISNAGSEIPQGPGPQYLLTGDRGILGLSLQVRYRIADPAAWLVASSDVDSVVRRIVIGATSSVIGRWTCNEVLRRQKHIDDHQSQSLQTAVLETTRTQVDRLALGVEITAIELTSIQPPSAVREAIVAIQDARVDQESWRDAANGEDAEVRLNAQRMALVAIADAKGRLDSIFGRVAAELQLFEADRVAFESGNRSLIAQRIQREAWEEILRSAGRIIALPTGERSQGLWLSVPDAEVRR